MCILIRTFLVSFGEVFSVIFVATFVIFAYDVSDIGCAVLYGTAPYITAVSVNASIQIARFDYSVAVRCLNAPLDRTP
jgi:hypothetical protein